MAAVAEVRKKERMAKHVKWMRLIEKEALPWFNKVPDRDIIVSSQAVREAKQAITSRYLGWSASLPMVLPAKVTIKSARIRNMTAMDLGGTSDPFCIFSFVGAQNTTDIIMETLSPIWEDLNYEYTVYGCSSVMMITVWDWDEGTDNDVIGKCYVHVEDLLKNPDHEVTRTLHNTAGLDQGIITIRVTCESLDTSEDPSIGELPSDEPDSCAEKAAALTRILWILGVPRAKAAFILQVVLRAEAPLHVIQRLGEVGIVSSLQVCNRFWLVDIIGRWKLCTDLQSARRERIRAAKAPKLEAAQEPGQSWDERIRALKKHTEQVDGNAKVDIGKYLNVESLPKGDRIENLKLALSFCDRVVLHVSDPEKTAQIVEDFQTLHEDLQAAGGGHDTLALDLMADVLAKYERDARLVDQVDEEVERVQKAVKADQGPDGVGLVPPLDAKKGLAFKWIKHKSEADKLKKYMPMEYYLEPFMKQHCPAISDMRQAVVDLGDFFISQNDTKVRRDVGPVVLEIAKIARDTLAELEEQYAKKRKAMGKMGAEMEKKKRAQQEENVEMCRRWAMINDEKMLPEIEQEMTDLLAHFKANLMWSFSAAVMMERERVEAQLLKLRQSEIERWYAEEEKARRDAEEAAQRAAAAEALAAAEAAGNAEEVARMEAEMELLKKAEEARKAEEMRLLEEDKEKKNEAGLCV